ncbi:MAG TPA: hypothetical protein VMS71_06795 [Candidatus Acidoferrum sp.]|nr:hypothetical protein [Candidatus Acidoferrum sp.]
MSSGDYIPVGRTSLVKKGEVSLQVQTEYASRPNPRITTCILQNGRVLHKIERSVDNPISTIEEQLRVETTIKRQHAEIIAIIQNTPYTPPEKGDREIVSRKPRVTIPRKAADCIAAVPGVQKVFHLDNEGNFMGDTGSEQFRKMFGPVFKSLHELMAIFGRLPGVGITREKGVYEVERDRLYFASAGTECFFVLVRRVDPTTDFEKAIKAAVLG